MSHNLVIKGDDSTKGCTRRDKVDLANVVLRLDPDSKIELSLDEWIKKGWRIEVSVSGLGSGFYNDEPYPNKEVALQRYEEVLEKVRNKEYELEVYGNNKIKLIIK